MDQIAGHRGAVYRDLIEMEEIQIPRKLAPVSPEVGRAWLYGFVSGTLIVGHRSHVVEH